MPLLKDLPEQAQSKKRRLPLPGGAFWASALFHGCLLFLLGGVVLIQGVVKRGAFDSQVVASAVDSPPEEMPAEALPESPQAAENEPGDAGTPDMGAPDQIVMDLASPSFAANGVSLSPLASMGTGGRSVFGQGQGASVGKGKGGGGNPFGIKGVVPGALVGNFYDLKQTAGRKPSDIGEGRASSARYLEVCAEFAKSWDLKILASYYKANTSLSAHQIFMPLMNAGEAPQAFEVNVKPVHWLVVYNGTVVAPENGTFRFAGQGDNILVVRWDGEIVLDGGLEPLLSGMEREPIGKSPDPGNRPMVAGKWFEMKAGKEYSMEVMLGEHGGMFASYLMIQKEGEKYEKRPDGKNPVLPVFQVSPGEMPSFIPESTGPAIASKAFTCREK